VSAEEGDRLKGRGRESANLISLDTRGGVYPKGGVVLEGEQVHGAIRWGKRKGLWDTGEKNEEIVKDFKMLKSDS